MAPSTIDIPNNNTFADEVSDNNPLDIQNNNNKLHNKDLGDNLKADKLEPIAIVGLSIKFPQNVISLDSLWETISQKKSAMTEFPKSRINLEAFYEPDTTKTNGFPLRGAHFVEGDISAFDAPFFSISPAEAAEMDPLQRGLLEASYRALENAGIPLENAAGSNTAVYIGSFADDYKALFHKDPEHAAQYSGSGVAPNMLANRISWAFDFTGTSLNLDTACSSSLVALHLACRGLISHDSNMALVGGCSLIFNPDMIQALNNQNFLSPSSRCFSFDHRANGYARGEGFGVVILKRLCDALKDNDNIRAIIRGTGSNQDGKTPGITQPSKQAQEQMMKETYDRAGLKPDRTRYFEAHGTGTPVGDPIEAGAIGSVFGKFRTSSDPLYCGSIKANIGHLEGASGIAGLIKSIIILEKGIIPPNAGFERVNPNINADALNLKFPTELIPWPTQGLRRISVNSFGFGGTNAHAILDDAYHYLQSHGLHGRHNTSTGSQLAKTMDKSRFKGVRTNEDVAESGGSIDSDDVLISHSSEQSDSLSDSGRSMSSNTSGNCPVENLHYSSKFNEGDPAVVLKCPIQGSDKIDLDEGNNGGVENVSREKCEPNGISGHLFSALPTLLTLSATDEGGLMRLAALFSAHFSAVKHDHTNVSKEYLERLAYTLNIRRSSLIWKSFATVNSLSDLRKDGLKLSKPVRVKSSPKLAFCFTGQGAQWYAMGRELLHYPVFKDSLEDIEQYLQTLRSSWSLIDELTRDQNSSNVNSPALSQPLCTAIQISMVDLLRSFEIHPAIVFGHSSGEIAAAYCSGALDRNSAMRVSFHRGALTDRVRHEHPVALTMLAVGLSESDVQGYLEKVAIHSQDNGISIGCINSPKSVTITGREDQIMLLKSLLDEDRIFARKLAVSIAYHSPVLESIVASYIELLGNLYGQDLPDKVPMISSVTAEIVSFKDLSQAGYWARNLISPVRFCEGLTRALSLFKIDNILEIGPHSALQAPINEILKSVKKSEAIEYSSLLIRSVTATDSLIEAIGGLHCRGHSVNLSRVNCHLSSGQLPAMLSDLPEYSFDHSRSYWRESRISKGYRFRKQPHNPFLGSPVPDWNPLHAIWRRKIRLSESQWLEHHKILGVVLYPAAAMLVMAIEAAKQMSESRTDIEISGYAFKDVTFLKSLSLTSDSDGMEVEFHLRPLQQSSDKEISWEEFHLYVCENDVWGEISRGYIRVEYKENITEVDQGREALEEVKSAQKLLLDCRASCSNVVDIQQAYDAFDAVGLGFGPAFQTLRNGSFNHEGEAVAEVLLHGWRLNGGEIYQRPYVIHPTALDGLLQLPFLALAEGGQKNIPSFVPTRVKKLWISHSGLSDPETSYIKACNKCAFRGFREALSTAVALDCSETKVLMLMEGYEMVALGNQGISSNDLPSQRTKCFNVDHKPDVDLLTQGSFDEYSQSIVPKLPPPIKMHRERNFIMNLFILISLKELETVDEKTLKPYHQKYLQWMRHKKGRLGAKQLQELNLRLRNQESLETLFDDLQSDSQAGKFLVEIGRNITKVLHEQVDALDLFFRSNLVKDYYIEINKTSNIKHFLVYVDALAHKYPGLRILEVGAGTGGMTRTILNTLTNYGENESRVPRFAHYTYTDISSSFFENAQHLFAGLEDRVTFKALDIERDPMQQGFEVGSYDLIIADNVIHATKNLDDSMLNTRKLLKSGGKLLLIELMEPESLQTNFAFGILPGWWRAVDNYRDLSAAVDEQTWHQILVKAGFSGIDLKIQDHTDQECHEHSALITTAQRGLAPTTIHEALIIIDAESSVQAGVAHQLQEAFLSIGLKSANIVFLDGVSIPNIAHFFCIALVEVDGTVLREIDSKKFLTIRDLMIATDDLIWVTCSGRESTTLPDYSIMNGLARTLRQEKTKMKLVTLTFESSKQAVSHFVDLILQVYVNTVGLSSDEYEPEYIERDGKLHIDRFVEAEYLDKDIASRLLTQQRDVKPFGGGIPLKLSISSPGLLDTLEFVEDSEADRALEADEIEIEIHASGVNFRDCLIALGRIPGNAFGFECAGIIRRVGQGCGNFKPGDRVCANTYGTYQTFGRCKAVQAMPLPDTVSFLEGAALPIAFTTAYYALCHVAKIRDSESILIHSAAGGTGQAAIQVAQLFNAEIYVTVGSEEKSQLLQELYRIPKDHIFYSRSGKFAQGIKRMTRERGGVDIVLNSLSGDALVNTWECVAPFGRFLEIGKKDILENGSLPMFQFAKNVSFHAIDLKEVDQYKPELFQELNNGVVSLLFDGKIETPRPLHVYGIGEVETAFRYLQGGKNTGKAVVEIRPEDNVHIAFDTKPTWQFEESATYVISGGLGGIGRSIARWMVQRGAKHLILLSRFGPKTEAAHTLIQELNDQGVEVECPAADISNRDLLRTTLKSLAQRMPMIKGCVQSSMVLADCPFETMSHEKWEAAIGPKVQGTCNLHMILPQGMDFFIMLSSIAGAIGSTTQANYAAGCAYQDALARHRVDTGEKATTFNLGVMLDDGVLTENVKMMGILKRTGYLLGITQRELYALLEHHCNPSNEVSTPLKTQIVVGVDVPASLRANSVHPPTFMRRPPFRHFYNMNSANVAKGAENANESNELSVTKLLSSVKSLDEAADIISNALMMKLSKALAVPLENLDSTKAMHMYGVDSLVAVELRNWFMQTIDADVAIFEILGNTSFHDLGVLVSAKSRVVLEVLKKAP